MQEASMAHNQLLRTANEQLAVTYGLKCPRPDPLCMSQLPRDLEGDEKMKPPPGGALIDCAPVYNRKRDILYNFQRLIIIMRLGWLTYPFLLVIYID
jgi:hypothetical protein